MNATITLPKADLKTLNRMAKGMGWTVQQPTTQQHTIKGGWTMDNPHLPYNPETDNPSPSGDKWWDIAENRNEVAQRCKEIDEERANGTYKPISMTREELRKLMGI